MGSDADLVVWDPEREQRLSVETLHMRVDYSPYEGRVVRGGPAVVMSRGEVIVDHGEWKGRPGRGQFLKRAHGTRTTREAGARRPSAEQRLPRAARHAAALSHERLK